MFAGVAIVGPELQGALKIRQGFVEFILGNELDSQVAKGFGVVGLEFDCAAELYDCLVELAAFAQRDAEVVEGDPGLGILLCGVAPECLLTGEDLASLPGRHAEEQKYGCGGDGG